MRLRDRGRSYSERVEASRRQRSPRRPAIDRGRR